MANIISKDSVPYRIWDKATSAWHKLNFNTNAKSVDADDGKTLETKIGAINGITNSLVSTATDIAASASTVYELNKNLDNSLNKSFQYLDLSLQETINQACSEYFIKGGTTSGRFQCADGWFSFIVYGSVDKYFSGYLTGITFTASYTFYCKAGADAVLKKLGSPEILTKTVTGNTTFDAGGTVLFAGIISATAKVATYEEKYGQSSTHTYSCTYSGSTITVHLGHNGNSVTNISITIIYALE